MMNGIYVYVIIIRRYLITKVLRTKVIIKMTNDILDFNNQV